ncbi:MAG: phosphoglycerate mutase [Peptococcaceae bacterium BRH_c8a]|nr:MAG: phosphoglycerate mutase [Peptococcaceae bacterium BRH_c8a]
MGCRIYLIRHGETIWNKDARFQGRSDIPLSPQGMEQARALGERLKGHKFAAFFSSGLSRAKLTAELVAEPHGQSVEVAKGLEELSFGDWEGLTIKEIRERYSEESSAWWARPLDTRIPGGETLAELAERSTAVLKQIVDKHPDQHVAVVAHGGTIRSVVGTVLGLDLNHYWRLRQDNASLTIIDFYGWDKAILMLYNDISHLGAGLVPGTLRKN